MRRLRSRQPVACAIGQSGRHQALFALGLLAGAFLPVLLQAGEYNRKLSVGDAAPAWSDLPGTDGEQHSLADLADKPVVVVAFTCLSCPVAADYEPRFDQLVKEYGGPSGSVAFVAICVNRIPEDRLPALTSHVKEKGLHFPFLFDKSQQIAKDYGAIYTPQYFVLDRDRHITYMGALDDDSNPEKASHHYLDDALKAAREGRAPEVTETVPRGCTIRYASRRRQRSKKDDS